MARLLLCLLVCLVAQASCKSAFKKVYDYVLSNSNPLLIPSATLPIEVGAQTSVLSINNIDRERNEVDSISWKLLTWQTDLKWNPADYNGIMRIVVPTDKVWMPDMKLYNAAGKPEFLSGPFIAVMANGLHMAAASVRLIEYCDNLAQDSCTRRAASSGQNNKYIKLIDPKNMLFDMNKILEDERPKFTNFDIVSESYEMTTFKGHEAFPDVVDMLLYKYSFKEKKSELKGPFRALFKWY